jgi:hypothetical protein
MLLRSFPAEIDSKHGEKEHHRPIERELYDRVSPQCFDHHHIE